ncbi:UNVERIFIED_ORG: hypothetical protein J2Y81_004977 [Paraburkholderia sediminicola]|nr:hypothetical protein [Paraburkholderia sediminicola]
MKNGFIYILINPEFPKILKIGKTTDLSERRAKKISSGTGVPQDFIVVFDALVGDVDAAEVELHEELNEYRTNQRREFFRIPPKMAINAVMAKAKKYPIRSAAPKCIDDLLPFFRERFSEYLDPVIVSIRLVTVVGACYLQVERVLFDGTRNISVDEIPLDGLRTDDPVTPLMIEHNAKVLGQLDEYDWIMVSNIFSPQKALAIAAEWERPGGRLDQIRGSCSQQV